MAYGSSAADRLTAVRASIDACLTAQSYGLRGRNKSMPRLDELRRLERDLMEEVLQASDGSMVSLGQMTRPT